VTGWAIKWRSNNRIAGKTERLMGMGYSREAKPKSMSGYTIMVFSTRREAREFIAEYCSYLKDRPDLQQEPHGWKMPVAVKVTVQVEPVTQGRRK